MNLGFLRALLRHRSLTTATLALATATFASSSALADPVLVNGTFSSTNFTGSSMVGGAFEPGLSITGWTVSGDYTYLYTPGTASTTGAACTGGGRVAPPPRILRRSGDQVMVQIMACQQPAQPRVTLWPWMETISAPPKFRKRLPD